jgi:hypothetical protein
MMAAVSITAFQQVTYSSSVERYRCFCAIHYLHFLKKCSQYIPSKKTVKFFVLFLVMMLCDRLCGLVVRVLGYRSGGPGSIPGITRKKK